jgi:hypothetical protein
MGRICMEIGHKVFYRKASGAVIFMTSEMNGHVRETTVEEDFEFYPQL